MVELGFEAGTFFAESFSFQGASNGQRQTEQFGLLDKIGSGLEEQLDHRVVARSGGEQDKGDVFLHLFEQAQGLNSAPPSQRLLSKDNLEWLGRESGPKFLGRAHQIQLPL